MTVIPDPEAALDHGRRRDAGRRHALRAAHLHRDARACARRWCAAGWRRRSGVSDDERRAASRSSTRTTPRTSRSGAAAAARLGSPVLDLGAAAGRVAIPLARDGHEVWALDRSPAMLAELAPAPGARGARRWPRRRAPRSRATCGRFDARAPRSALVLVAMNTLQVLTEPRGPARVPAARARPPGRGGRARSSTSRCPTRRRSSPPMGVERPGGRHRDPPPAPCWCTRPGTTAGSRTPSTLEFTLRDRGAPRRRRRSREALRHHRVHLFTPDELAELMARRRDWSRSRVAGDFAGAPLGRVRRAPGAPLPGGRVSALTAAPRPPLSRPR